ncbi:hypothetical protein GGR58DRAFT_519114 [Xylaria digitata]|nr:hypothetical protein GGR58DRAFT_519114 [Xylaria digitata]
MAVAVAEYSHTHFQGLPTLEAARSKFETKNGPKLIEVTKDFFVREGMDRTFGLALMHRHFDIGEGEKLVEYEGTSAVWPSVVNGMEDPHPHIWSFSQSGNLTPTEFRYSNGQSTKMGEKELAFFTKFKGLLDQYEVTDLFGLAQYPGDDFNGTCEITVGNTNINLKPADYPEDLVSVDTVWFFSEPLWKRGCRCTCNANGDNHPHGRHVYTRSG